MSSDDGRGGNCRDDDQVINPDHYPGGWPPQYHRCHLQQDQLGPLLVDLGLNVHVPSQLTGEHNPRYFTSFEKGMGSPFITR